MKKEENCSVFITSRQLNADTEARADDEPSADKVEARADDITDYDEPNELCVVCGLSKEDDEEQETWIQCT